MPRDASSHLYTHTQEKILSLKCLLILKFREQQKTHLCNDDKQEAVVRGACGCCRSYGPN